jgi:hypothetical protein
MKETCQKYSIILSIDPREPETYHCPGDDNEGYVSPVESE